LTGARLRRHTINMIRTRFAPLLLLLSLSLLLLSLSPFLAHAAEEKVGERPLDGVSIEALETYQNPKGHQLDFGLGVWPLNPYFNGYSVDVGYNHIFNRTYSWEILRASYIYTVDKGLVAELANTYGQDPKNTIERPDFIVSSDFKYEIAYGKFIFANKYIRYFRSQLIAGPAFAHTNKGQVFGGDLGWGFEAHVNDNFSWKFEIRDYIASIGSTVNNLMLSFGTGYAF
jgi:outer membrane beta-barrel protein